MNPIRRFCGAKPSCRRFGIGVMCLLLGQLVLAGENATLTTTNSSTVVQNIAIERACYKLVLDYAYYRDRPDPEAVAQLFTEQAEMRLMGQVYQGRKAIHARTKAGIGGPVFRHLMSTIRIFPLDRDRARGVSYVTVLSGPAGELPRPLQQYAAVGEYHDEFVRTAEGWKIDKREFVAVFVPPANP